MNAAIVGMLSRITGLAAAALLAACGFAPRQTFVNAAYDYNLAVEDSQNQMLLLNIVRASKRHPMYFTAISALRGNITSSAGFGDSSIPVGGGSASAGTIAPNASYSANPSFDLAVLDSKSFTRGILTPVPVETFEYYWDQGWPRELLLNLFIASIKTDAEPARYNTPGAPGYADFRKRLRELFCPGAKSPSECSIEFKGENDYLDVPDFGKALALQDALKVEKAGLRAVRYTKDDKDKDEVEAKKEQDKAGARKDSGGLETHEIGAIRLAAKKKDVRIVVRGNEVCTGNVKPDKKCDTHVEMRSPEAMLYYLGEILRRDRAERPTIRGCSTDESDTTLVFDPDIDREVGDDNAVAVRYMGQVFAIPNEHGAKRDPTCHQPQSMHVLSLIGQLIGQLKESSDLPVTGAVTVVGGANR